MTSTMFRSLLHQKGKYSPDFRFVRGEDGIWHWDDTWIDPFVELEERLGRFDKNNRGKCKVFRRQVHRWWTEEMHRNYKANFHFRYGGAITPGSLIVIDDLYDADAGFYRAYEAGDHIKVARITTNRNTKRAVAAGRMLAVLELGKRAADPYRRTYMMHKLKYMRRNRDRAGELQSVEHENRLYFKKPWFHGLFSRQHRYICTAAEEIQLHQLTTLIGALNMQYQVAICEKESPLRTVRYLAQS